MYIKTLDPYIYKIYSPSISALVYKYTLAESIIRYDGRHLHFFLDLLLLGAVVAYNKRERWVIIYPRHERRSCRGCRATRLSRCASICSQIDVVRQLHKWPIIESLRLMNNQLVDDGRRTCVCIYSRRRSFDAGGGGRSVGDGKSCRSKKETTT